MGDIIYWKKILQIVGATMVAILSVIIATWPLALYGIWEGKLYFGTSCVWFLIIGVFNQNIQSFIENLYPNE